MNIVLLKNISLVGLHWGAYSLKEPSRVPVVWKELLDLFASGAVKPVVYTQTWPLEQIASGLEAIEKRQTWGKAVVRVKEEDSSLPAKL